MKEKKKKRNDLSIFFVPSKNRPDLLQAVKCPTSIISKSACLIQPS